MADSNKTDQWTERDLAYYDEEAPIEGWPEIDVDEILLGEWVPGKQPSSIAARRYLAAVVRFCREDTRAERTKSEGFANLSRTPRTNAVLSYTPRTNGTHGTPDKRLADLRWLRESHRRNRVHYLAYEASVVDLRRRMLADWTLWRAKTEGGVQ